MTGSPGGPAQWLLIGAMWVGGFLLDADAVSAGVSSSSCPANATVIAPGVPIQDAVDRAGEGALLCLKNGVHRAQAIRPRSGQRFLGEGQTVLNGSRLLTGFRREGDHWVVTSQMPRRPKHGECLPSAPFCNQPEAIFIDDRPLTRAAGKGALTGNGFYIDHASGEIYLADDPTNRTVEVTVALFAFESAATDVSINNIIVEKFASAAQKGAVHAREGARWTIENCEVRLNSGGGIGVGSGSRVRNCDVHDNGQIGIAGNGRDIRIEDNHIWANNTRGFDATWEAGGVKIALSDRVVFRGNHVHDNNGPGLWCDIDCRNVLYEGNTVEGNQDIGIFHEISFRALIRKNVVRHNGLGNRGWFWVSDIVLAASQDVEVLENRLVVAPGRCGIMLIDQGRRDNGKRYKTRNNLVSENEMTFEGTACAGGVSDAKPGDENFGIVATGNNLFEGNTYRVGRSQQQARFVWGRAVTDWEGFRHNGQERSGSMVFLDRAQ
jgi:Right handed beta helix region